jgi:Type I restriction enzyme R protein N terminus (HSDR_N)
MPLATLNFNASFDFQISENKDKLFIYDILRKANFILTPEEWVRQHWLHWLIKTKGHNPSMLVAEKKIMINNQPQRFDLLQYLPQGIGTLYEFKAPHIPLNEAVFEQVARYNSLLKAKRIVLSNGLQHIMAHYDGQTYQFMPFDFEQF